MKISEKSPKKPNKNDGVVNGKALATLLRCYF